MFRRRWTGMSMNLIPKGLIISAVVAASFSGTQVAADDATAANPHQVKQMRALKINPHPPKIDGRLDDAIWTKAEFFSGFTQKDPKEGEPAANQTEIAVVYDEQAVYIAARMHSTDPDNIRATVSRRDRAGTSERVIVSLDTYHDRRTAYSFAVTAGGVQVDYYHPEDREGNRDYGFDPVWKSDVDRSADGWTAEMRIPFTQLRFANRNDQVWGINVNRFVPTDNEDSYWILVPKDDTGWSSKMGELVGINGIKPSRRIELMPYFASDATVRSEIDADDPFAQQTAYNTRVGGNIKMGVGPNLTLEGTVNPDFGQVEADPAEVNLSAFETYFPERRPFFTEGSQLFSGGGANYFYSRRIGAPPSYYPDSDYVKMPDNTSILGAAKLTGRLNSGLSVGMLGAVTDREKAQTFDGTTDLQSVEVVEPRAAYGVARLQQEFGKDASTVGAIVTGVERDLATGGALGAILPKRAVSGGTDWNLRFSGGKYEFKGSLGASYVEGGPDAIAEIQQSSARNFQRPDAEHVSFDPTRTSLVGYRGHLRFAKRGGKHWLWGGRASAETPGFELNDIGMLQTADDIDTGAWLEYRETEPGRVFQEWWTSASVGSGWNFGRDRQYTFVDLESVWTFKNFIGTFIGYEAFTPAQSDNLTRGGPSMGTGGGWNVWNSWWSGGQRKTTWNFWGGYWTNELGNDGYQAGGRVTVRPGDRWEISVSPRWRHSISARQYVDTQDGGRPETYDQRYIFSFIERSQLVTQLRLNYAFTPKLTLEMYAEPFAASGRYYDFGELEAARSKHLRTYGTDGTTITNNNDGTYTVTDGSDTFEIDQPDFNVLSFRSNLVLRWEWSPGSTLYFVWQQNRSDQYDDGMIVGPSNMFDAFNAPGDNFVALKITYWIPFM
ncbi:MAG: carbohydrate binding family 9 domain-containing protein, partial [Candidatus Latescibacterota bacterium]